MESASGAGSGWRAFQSSAAGDAACCWLPTSCLTALGDVSAAALSLTGKVSELNDQVRYMVDAVERMLNDMLSQLREMGVGISPPDEAGLCSRANYRRM